MCKNPMYRVPVPEDVASSLFIPGYKNGAYVIPCSNQTKFSKLLNRLEFTLNSELKFNMLSSAICKIPCGKCIECKIQNSKEWAQRSVCEAQMHEHNWFITLTYDDEHLPEPIPTYSRHNFEFGLWSPLLYEDFQAFKKRLLEHMRYNFGVQDIRFLMCGEYGPTNGRPHFHCILYNCPLPDVEHHSEKSLNGRNYVYLTSKLIEEKWSKGFITIGEVNWETSAYVGRYVLKKFGNLEEYDYQNLCYSNGWEPLPPEMRQASRNPGLARPYYEENKNQIYKNDKIILPNGQVAKPCSYFDKLYDLEDPELLALLKENRMQKALIREVNEISRFNSSAEHEEYKRKKSESFERKIQKLKRPL